MARCIFENLTEEQALILAQWFEGQGEQDTQFWFEQDGCISPVADVRRDGGFIEHLDNGDVVVYCR